MNAETRQFCFFGSLIFLPLPPKPRITWYQIQVLQMKTEGISHVGHAQLPLCKEMLQYKNLFKLLIILNHTTMTFSNWCV